MTIYVRIQDSKYGTDSLFEEGRLSNDMSWNDHNARLGVSVCHDLEALMDYFVERPIEIGNNPVIITLEGEPSPEQPLDAEQGELLIIPTRVVSVQCAEEAGFFDGINERLGW